MKTSDLVTGVVYVDITDNKIPLRFTGNIQKNINHGFNTYGDYAEFEPVKTEVNKNWMPIGNQEIFFDEELGNSRIILNSEL